MSSLARIGGALALALALAAPAWAGSQDGLAITTDIFGPVLKFDWPAVEIGIASYEAGPTGITVFRFPKGAAGAVDARGGGPGTLYAVSTEEVDGKDPTLIDLDTAAGEVMWDAILASVPDEPAFTPPAAPVPAAPATLELYAGKYRFGPSAVIAGEIAHGKLWATLYGMGFFDLTMDRKTPLVPISDSEFYVDGRYKTRLSFVRDPGGKVTGAVVNPGRWQQAGTREPD